MNRSKMPSWIVIFLFWTKSNYNSPLFIYFSFLVVTIASHWVGFWMEYLNRDEFSEYYHASIHLNGGIPFKDFIQVRWLLHLFAILGVLLTPESTFGMHIIVVIITSFTSFFIYFFCKNLWNGKVGFWAGFFFSLYTGLMMAEFFALMGETVSLLPMTIAIAILSRFKKKPNEYWTWVVAGALTVISFFGKQFGTLLLPMVAIIGFWGMRLVGWNFIDVLIRGFFVVLGVIIGLIFILGLFFVIFDPVVDFKFFLEQQWYHMIERNFFIYFPASQTSGIESYLKRAILTQIGVLLTQIFLWSSFFFLLWRELFWRKRIKYIYLLLIILVGYSAVYLMGYNFYQHYQLMALPFLCICGGLVWYWLKRKWIYRIIMSLMIIIVCIRWSVFYILIAADYFEYSRDIPFGKPYQYYEQIDCFREQTKDAEAVFVWGLDPGIYYYLDRLPITPVWWLNAFSLHDKKIPAETQLAIDKDAQLVKRSLSQYENLIVIDLSSLQEEHAFIAKLPKYKNHILPTFQKKQTHACGEFNIYDFKKETTSG